MTTRRSTKTAVRTIKTNNDTKLPFQPEIPAPDLSEPAGTPKSADAKATLADVTEHVRLR